MFAYSIEIWRDYFGANPDPVVMSAARETFTGTVADELYRLQIEMKNHGIKEHVDDDWDHYRTINSRGNAILLKMMRLLRTHFSEFINIPNNKEIRADKCVVLIYRYEIACAAEIIINKNLPPPAS